MIFRNMHEQRRGTMADEEKIISKDPVPGCKLRKLRGRTTRHDGYFLFCNANCTNCGWNELEDARRLQDLYRGGLQKINGLWTFVIRKR